MQLIGFAFSNAALEYLSTLQPKVRKQIIKKAKALINNPFPQGCKKLQGVVTDESEPIYRERSGDYRILYVVRSNLTEVVILDIDDRKDVYKMPNKKSKADDELRMSEEDFDEVMRSALGVPPPPDKEPDEKPAKGRRVQGAPR